MSKKKGERTPDGASRSSAAIRRAPVPEPNRSALPTDDRTRSRPVYPGVRTFVLVMGIVGAVVGGAWLGLAASVLLGPRGTAQDLVAAAIALFLLGVLVSQLEDVGSRRAFSLTVATAMSTVFLVF